MGIAATNYSKGGVINLGFAAEIRKEFRRDQVPPEIRPCQWQIPQASG